MEMHRQAIGGSNPIQEESFQGKPLETFKPVAKGSDPTPKRALLKARSGVSTMANSDMQEVLSPSPYHLTQIIHPKGHRTQRLGNPMSMNMKDEAVEKRCVPTPWRMRARPMAVGT